MRIFDNDVRTDEQDIVESPSRLGAQIYAASVAEVFRGYDQLAAVPHFGAQNVRFLLRGRVVDNNKLQVVDCVLSSERPNAFDHARGLMEVYNDESDLHFASIVRRGPANGPNAEFIMSAASRFLKTSAWSPTVAARKARRRLNRLRRYRPLAWLGDGAACSLANMSLQSTVL